MAHEGLESQSRHTDVGVAEIFELQAVMREIGMIEEEGMNGRMHLFEKSARDNENPDHTTHENRSMVNGNPIMIHTLTDDKNEAKGTSLADGNEMEGGPIDFSSLVGIGKVDPETLNNCRKHGIRFDMKIDAKEPSIVIGKHEIEISVEKEKSRKCEFWPDKQAFLAEFELSNVPEQHLEPLGQLLWEFNHIFFNESHPEQFHAGLNIPPVHVAQIPGITPRKEKVRQCPDSKLKYLKKHIENLLETGVITEVTDISDVYASPVHIVLEERYIASKDAVEQKSRLTVDARAINKTLMQTAYPLPLCDDFRRKIAKRGYKVFSNLDMASFYHQIPIDKETSKKFGIHALGRIFMYTRLLMGCSQAPSIGQSIVDQAFDHHENTHPFEDDVTVASKSEEEHLQTDLPIALATASHYNMLMKAPKCVFFKNEARILGHLVGEEKITLSSEKIKKIRELPFPDTKKKLISALAFFQYFNRLCPRLSELSAPLRRLAKDGVRFKPTEVHKKAFQEVKDHLLDEKLNVLRMPSANLEDTIVIFTDASASSTSCVVTQMMERLNPDNEHETDSYIS